MKKIFDINENIRSAKTLPPEFYKKQKIFDLLKKKVFLKSWQWIGDEDLVKYKNSVCPKIILEDFLSEPIILTRDKKSDINCMTNVCTHRGNLLVLKPGKSTKIRCMYHGRRFDNQGNFEFMPDFEETKKFPRKCDNLHKFPLVSWNKLLFVGLNPVFDFNEVISIMEQRVGFLPLEKFKFDKSLSKNFEINAHWSLYCDNYLEGFHVPFVHEGLNKILDSENYDTELYKFCNLQIGYSNDQNDCFKFPKNHIDSGKNIAAYYYWIFPNMMFNFYPWGLSINIVKPISLTFTKISFRSYIFDETKLDKGAGSNLEKVEEEDELVVQNVQKGINSSFYKAGRFSPTKEKGVHHFHTILSKFMNL